MPDLTFGSGVRKPVTNQVTTAPDNAGLNQYHSETATALNCTDASQRGPIGQDECPSAGRRMNLCGRAWPSAFSAMGAPSRAVYEIVSGQRRRRGPAAAPYDAAMVSYPAEAVQVKGSALAPISASGT
jgi:hypothetical protein